MLFYKTVFLETKSIVDLLCLRLFFKVSFVKKNQHKLVILNSPFHFKLVKTTLTNTNFSVMLSIQQWLDNNFWKLVVFNSNQVTKYKTVGFFKL